MIHDKREFTLGVLLLVGFFAVHAMLFAPLHANGRNTIDYLDNVFNAISKHSAYFIPKLRDKVRAQAGKAVDVMVRAGDEAQAQRMEELLAGAGIQVERIGNRLLIDADLGRLLTAALDDAELLYRNDGDSLERKHLTEPRLVGYDWHRLLGSIARDLDQQQQFAAGKVVREVMTKGVEPAYNYYGIEAVPMQRMLFIVLAALAGYVLYTVWYGFAILYLFEGWGLKLEH
ncbi:MAG: hypothetical protein N2Z63_01500 [Thiobacillaceae bacterium]|nr:hypothetical protein [Thiobacillaceae bacterium]